jgi:hypothetical protein
MLPLRRVGSGSRSQSEKESRRRPKRSGDRAPILDLPRRGAFAFSGSSGRWNLPAVGAAIFLPGVDDFDNQNCQRRDIVVAEWFERTQSALSFFFGPGKLILITGASAGTSSGGPVSRQPARVLSQNIAAGMACGVLPIALL